MQPDRDTILDMLRQAGRPLSRRQISRVLGLDKAESDRLVRPVIRQLMAEGRVVRNRRAAYGLPENMDLISGRVSAHADGFGFVIPEGDGVDLFLPPKQMRLVFHGDRVLAAVAAVDARGRKEGVIVEVVERAHTQVVGRFVAESGVAMVVPDDPRLTRDVLIPLDATGQAKPGQIVVARITDPPTEKRAAVGEIVAVLGRADEPGIATEIAIHAHELPSEFPREVLAEADAFGDAVDPRRISGRMDLRDLPLVTIDGADARDFDDAVYAQRTDSGFRLIVAIADVAEYVTTGSALDGEAQSRGTSVYFPDRVVPMLPEALSNGLCSLKPDVDRLTLVCDMKLDANGKVTSSRFAEGVIRSAARLTYDQVRAMVETGDAELNERFGHVRGALDNLFDVYRLLARRRARRGALDFDSNEVRFVFAADGRVEQLRRYRRHDAHRLIEECMITANVEAARHAGRIRRPVLYRVHEPPPADKLEGLEAFLHAHGLKRTWKEQPEPADLTRIQQSARGTPIEPLVDAVLLRSLSLAVYQPENAGHFGLALSAYAHFTSPIRRYPDLLLHRAIKHAARQQKPEAYPYGEAAMTELGRRCSWLERRAEQAGRDVDDRLKCQFMQRHLGDVFDGIVTGVTGFGLFVEITEFGVSGLVHVTALPNDYYHFDPVGHALTGERRGLRFRLADRVRVDVAGVNLEERKIDFRLMGKNDEPAETGGDAGGRKPRRGKRGRKRS